MLNLRLDRGLNQREIARACKVSFASVSKIETGASSPMGWFLFGIARKLRVPSDYLLDESQPYPYTPLSWRGALEGEDGKARLSFLLTREEKAFLLALRRASKDAQETAYAVSEASLEALSLALRAVLTKGRPSEELMELVSGLERRLKRLAPRGSQEGRSRGHGGGDLPDGAARLSRP